MICVCARTRSVPRTNLHIKVIERSDGTIEIDGHGGPAPSVRTFAAVWLAFAAVSEIAARQMGPGTSVVPGLVVKTPP